MGSLRREILKILKPGAKTIKRLCDWVTLRLVPKFRYESEKMKQKCIYLHRVRFDSNDPNASR